MNVRYRSAVVVLALIVLSTAYGNIGCGGSDSGSSTTDAPTAEMVPPARAMYTTTPVSVSFSEAMDQATVEAAFSVAGSPEVEGTFAWTDNTLTFTPNVPWKTNHQYTLTVGTDARDADGTPMAEAYTTTFTPVLNMHDVNADGIDDFLLGALQYDHGALSNTGAAYLFLGRSEWTDIALDTQKASATFVVNGDSSYFGFAARVIGDFNGDGFADYAMSTGSDQGIVIIRYGGTEMEDVLFTSGDYTTVDGLVFGEAPDTAIGYGIKPLGDVNGDGLADFMIGGGVAGDNTFWLVLGRTTDLPDPAGLPGISAFADATYTIEGNSFDAGLAMTGCDLNGDELDDIVLGGSSIPGGTDQGKVFVIWGSATPTDRDLRSTAADATLTGPSVGDLYGVALACGDVNADGIDDLIVGAAGYNGGIGSGRVYVYAGSADADFSTLAPAATYDGNAVGQFLGLTLCVPGDVNGDDIDDIFVGAPTDKAGTTEERGTGYLFYGASPLASVDLGAGGVADASFIGEEGGAGDAIYYGFCKTVGDVNGDGIDDLLTGAPLAPLAEERGIIYLMFGGAAIPSLDYESQTPDVSITGAGIDDRLWCQPYDT